MHRTLAIGKSCIAMSWYLCSATYGWLSSLVAAACAQLLPCPVCIRKRSAARAAECWEPAVHSPSSAISCAGGLMCSVPATLNIGCCGSGTIVGIQAVTSSWVHMCMCTHVCTCWTARFDANLQAAALRNAVIALGCGNGRSLGQFTALFPWPLPGY